MKRSFSTKGWQEHSWSDFVALAGHLGYKGIELYYDTSLQAAWQLGLGDREKIRAAVRRLANLQLEIPCVDAAGELQDVGTDYAVEQSFRDAIEFAAAVQSPALRVRTLRADTDEGFSTRTALMKILPVAKEYDITVLVETVGPYANSKSLCQILDSFADDHLAALWDVSHSCQADESPETTIHALGAYVRHVHLRDAADGGQRLVGEGDLPLDEVFLALGSINYDGFISCEWSPDWLPGLTDLEVVLAHFAAWTSQFTAPARSPAHLYSNNRRTGSYVWKKDNLIDKTLPQVLETMAETFPDQTAIRYTTLDYTRSYSAFNSDVDRTARMFIALGVRPGDKVAIWATNVPEWFLTFWAVTKIGAVLVTVNTDYKIYEAEYLLRQSDTHTLVMIERNRDANYAAIIQELCPELKSKDSAGFLHSRRLPFLRSVITVGFDMPGCLNWNEAMQRHEEVPQREVLRRAHNINVNDVCNMQYTSGTTGFPKGVMLTHYNIVNNGKCIGDRMDLSTADRFLIQVPMFHCFGMVLSMLASVTHGTTMYPVPYFNAGTALAAIAAERITAVNGVPTMFIAILEHPEFDQVDFSSLRTGIMAGSPCPVSVMRQVQEKMNLTEITIVFGQTESSPGCTMSTVDDPIEVRVTTVGRPLPEVECRIIDPETGAELPPGKDGEFVARGYNIMKGYYKMPSATALAIDDEGWLHTGDLAQQTPEGNYRITGRIRDMIIRGGENIYPKEIEDFLYTHPDVRDVQVVGVPDKQYGEEICACVIAREGADITAEELTEFTSERLAISKVPRYIVFVEDFPMNAAGKIQKNRLRDAMAYELGLTENS